MQKVLLLFSLLTMLLTNIATGLPMSYEENRHKASNTSLRINDFPPTSKYIIDFDAAPPTFNWIDSNKVQIIGDVLLSADTATDAGFDYIINMEIEGGPSGSTPINFPSTSLTSASKFQQSSTKINISGGKTALVYAIDGRTGSNPITYHRDPSTKMTFSLELDNGEDFVNTTYEVGDMDYNFISSSETSVCFDLGEPNNYSCRYSYIDRIIFLSGGTNNQYSFSNPAAIHQVNATEFYSNFTDVNGNGIPDVSDDGRVPSTDPDGNIQVYNPNNIGKEIKFTYDDYGSGIEGDADGFHDFDSRNQVMSFLTGMTFDIPEPIIVCTDTVHTDLVVSDTSLIVDDLFCITLPEGSNYKLIPNIGLDCDTCQIVCFTADTTISYTITWIGEENGCPHTAPLNINVLSELGGCVREDLNRDGVANDGNTAMENIVVNLFNENDTINPIQITVTNEDGKYLFDSLPAGKYYVSFIPEIDFNFAPGFTPIGDMVLRDGYSDIICLESGESDLIYDALLEKCYTTALSITEAKVFAGQEVCVTVTGGSNYEWTPAIAGYENCDTCTVFKIIADSSRIYTVRSKSNFACAEDEAQLDITTAFINISDPCNCLGNKQFGEIITIYSFSEGETWTYYDGTGLYDRNDPSMLVPLGTVATYGGLNAAGFHTYNLEGIHIDSIGYTTKFTNGTQNLQISNLCYETELCNGLPIASLGGCVNEDLNRDGLANDGLPPVFDVPVFLYTQGDTINPINSTVTDLDGKYLFDNLTNGKYFVSFVAPENYLLSLSTLPVGNLTDRDGFTELICVGIGEDVRDVDALIEQCYSTELSITEANVFAGQEVCVTVTGGGNYEWTPALPAYENCDTCTVFKITADSSIVYTVRSKDKIACATDEAQLTITTAFIDLSDPCNCLGNKQFGEVITIYSFAEGETWTYYDGTGLYDRNDPSVSVPFGTIMTYGGVNADGFHIYNMEGVHIDSIGYTSKFTNGIQNLQISNLCYETELCDGLPIGSLGGCVREDLNRDALANDGNTAMDNILVNLYLQGDTINPIAATTTSLDGKYLFDDLPNGKYIVEFIEPTDFILPSTALPVGNLTDRNGFTDVICLGIGEDKVDVDALLAKCYGIGLGHRNFEIYEGDSVTVSITEPGDYLWQPSTSIDCTNCQTVTLTPESTTTYTIQWNGQDSYNCTHESWVTVTVLPIPCSMSTVNVAIESSNYPNQILSTDASVAPASTMTYQWQSSAINCEEGFTDIVGATTSTYEINETTTDQFFRIQVRELRDGKEICAVPSPCITLGQIAGCVNEDITGSGFFPLNNVSVNLYTLEDQDTPLTSTTTNDDGKYHFTNLPTGKYFVEFIAPYGYLFPVADLPVGNLAERNGITEVICLEPNEDQLTIDAYVGQCENLVISSSAATIVKGETVSLSSDAGTLQWLANGGVLCSGCASIEVAPTETTVYQFQRINPIYGCVESGSIKIEVLQPYVEIESPCNCDGGFIFRETVTIYSYSANDNWMLSDNSGFYQMGFPLKEFPSGTPIIYAGVNEDGLHVYTLKGQHKDKEGYQLSVGNGDQNIQTSSNTMSVSNLCFLADSCPEVDTPDVPVVDPDLDPEATPSFPGVTTTDCTKPNIYAIHGLSIDLMQSGMIQVWANDFAHNSLDECLNNGSLVSRIWHSSMSDKSPTQLNAIYELPENLIFTCEHIGLQEVSLYIIDENGDWNFVKTYIDVQDNLAACSAIEAGNTAMVSGTITDWKGNTVQHVSISSMDKDDLLMGQMNTTTEGTYAFELPINEDYTIIPKKDTNPLNGVSTFDLVLMTKHILGVQPFDNPYQWIAADVNTSGTVTAFDIVQLRKMILGIDKQFVNNTSWRFLAADYAMDTTTPLKEHLEEYSSIIDLHQNKKSDFVAIKIGDINGNAQASTLQQSTARNSKEVFTIEIVDQLLQAGKTYNIPFTSEQIKEIQGYQFTLAYTDLSVNKVQAGIMDSEHFGLHRLDEGLLTASWNTTANDPTDTQLFTLQITADQTIYLSEVLRLQNNPTITEAYDQDGNELAVAFSFTDIKILDAFELFQNEPNPFNGQTNIGFYLPGTSEVELILRDDTGRIIKRWKESRAAGLNYIQVEELENNKGLIYYQLITDYGVQSKKMLQLR